MESQNNTSGWRADMTREANTLADKHITLVAFERPFGAVYVAVTQPNTGAGCAYLFGHK